MEAHDWLVLMGLAVLVTSPFVVSDIQRVRRKRRLLPAWDQAAADGGLALGAVLEDEGWLPDERIAELRAQLGPGAGARRKTLEKLVARGYERADAEPQTLDADEAPAWLVAHRNVVDLHLRIFADAAVAELYIELAETLRAPAARAEALTIVAEALYLLPDELPHVVRRLCELVDALRDDELVRVGPDAAELLASLREHSGLDTPDERLTRSIDRLLARCREARTQVVGEARSELEIAIEYLEDDGA